MDAELTKAAAAMKQRALQFAGAVGGQAPSSASATPPKPKIKPKTKPTSKLVSSLMTASAASSSTSTSTPFSISSYAAAAPAKFRTKNKHGVLKMIIDKLRERHMAKVAEPLTFEEILKEISYTDMSPNMRDFLQRAVRDNEKISCKDGGKFAYKPLYNLKNSTKLLALLKRKEEDGLPAVLLSDIRESMPRWEVAMKKVNDQVLTFTRPDKQEVVFHNDAECHLPVRAEYQQLWRGISVEGLSDHDIETYLNNAGISTMKGQTLKRPNQAGGKKKGPRKRTNAKILNVHLDAGMLIDYSKEGQGQS